MVHPTKGERFYLRLLLHNVRGPQSFSELFEVNGVRHSTYRAAAQAHGLLEDDDHWRQTLSEAASIQSGRQLRAFFAVILVFGLPDAPERLFDEFAEQLSDDLLHDRRKRFAAAVFDDKVANAALRDINRLLLLHNKQLADFPRMPIPPNLQPDDNDADDAFVIDADRLATQIQSLNAEQRSCFDEIIAAVRSGNSCMFFIDAPGGTGKT